MKEKKKRKILTPDELDANYHKFMNGKELANNGKAIFEEVIKKAAATKPRGSKRSQT